MGFPRVWRYWASILLSTTSTRILMNGTSGDPICHTRGLRQGDPLSLMLFLLVMEVLNALICELADGRSFSRFGARLPHRASFYVDDLVVFITPSAPDLQMARCILELFHDASGLGCNMVKCQMVPIRCTDDQVAEATNTFPCQIVAFSVKYLGITFPDGQAIPDT
jgi:hypothetical protein